MISLISLGLQKLIKFVWYGLKIEAVKKLLVMALINLRKLLLLNVRTEIF